MGRSRIEPLWVALLTLVAAWTEPVSARIIVVQPGDGSGAISRAVAQAAAGDTVRVEPGAYRGEAIRFVRSGRADAPIVLEAAAPGVVVSGSRVVTTWQRLAGPRPIYRTTGWTLAFGAYDARILQDPDSPTARGLDARHRARNQVFVGGRLLEEVPLRSRLGPGTFFLDSTRDFVDVWLPDGGDPVDHVVELADTQGPLLTTDGRSHVIVRGLTFQHGANRPQEHALVRIEGGASCELVNCSVRFAAGAGVTVSGTGHRVVGCVLVNNGQLGLHSSRATDCAVLGGETAFNNTHPGKRYDPTWEAGGMKVSRSRRFRVQSHLSRFNIGSGIWFDIDNHGAVIVGCTSHNNGAGIHYEISYTAMIANNLVFNNQLQGQPRDGPFGQGIYISSSAGSRVYQNTCYGNATRGIEVAGPVRADGASRLVAAYGNHVFNNIVADNQRQNARATDVLIDHTGLDPLPGIVNPVVPLAPNRLDYNVYYRSDGLIPFGRSRGRRLPSLAAWQTATGQDANSTWGDPGFVDPIRRDFRLQEGSEAVDQGMTLPGIRIDHGNRRRPLGAGYDAGAIEMR